MKKPIAFCMSVLLPLLLAACASVPTVQHPGHLLDDKLFTASSERISAEDVFAVSDAMRRYLKVDIASLLQAKGPQQGLIEALNGKSQLQVQYDSATPATTPPPQPSPTTAWEGTSRLPRCPVSQFRLSTYRLITCSLQTGF